MRLRPNEVRAFVTALDPYFKGNSGELKLFGSRVSDHLKGGDIDLLVIVEDDDTETVLKKSKHSILAAIQAQIGEQKIDLVIVGKAGVGDPFVQSVLPTSVILHRWER